MRKERTTAEQRWVLALTSIGCALAFPPQRRGWAIGIFSGVTGLAVLGGPMIGGCAVPRWSLSRCSASSGVSSAAPSPAGEARR
ncbi:hypothetical protein [Kribbella alba]|uniref:hypothetical protein n=1 Tax=Kribbella alba TaxID=190197 RepID=UPI0031E2467F